MTEMIFTTPDRDEMINRLIAFDGTGYVVKHLYPRLLEHAGTEITPMGLVVAVNLAVADYLRRVNGGRAMDRVMSAAIPSYIRIMTDDLEAREAALDFLRDTGQPDGRPRP